MSTERLRWQLYNHQAAPGGDSSPDDLPTAWNTSFQRAIHGLANDGLIKVQERELESFEECVLHFPSKTLKASKRSLREIILPALAEWSGSRPKYGEAANEQYYLSALPRSQFEELCAQWHQIQERLRPIFGQTAEPSDDLLLLICKGRNLFSSSDIAVENSLTLCIERACSRNLLPESLSSELLVFRERFLPTGSASALRFKSTIHALVDVPSSGRCSLRADTLAYLHQKHTDLIENMPGFQKKTEAFPWAHSNHFAYDLELRTVIDHSVFQKFHFIGPST